MKVGDRVYCIKDIEFVSKYITTKVFVSGNVYIIYEIGDDSITIFNFSIYSKQNIDINTKYDLSFNFNVVSFN